MNDMTLNNNLNTAQDMREEIGGDFHDQLVEVVYDDAARIADREVTRTGEKPRFDMDRALDRLVTSRKWTALATLLPVGMGLVLTFLVAQMWLLLDGLI